MCVGAPGVPGASSYFFGGCVWKFFGLGILGVQVMAGNDCWEGWGVRGIPQAPGAGAYDARSRIHSPAGAHPAGTGCERWERERRLPAAPFPVSGRAGSTAKPPNLGAEDDPEKQTPPAPECGQDRPWLLSDAPAAHTGAGGSRKTPPLKPAGLFIQVLPAVPSAPPAPSPGLPAASARRFAADFMAITQICSFLSFSRAAPS